MARRGPWQSALAGLPSDAPLAATLSSPLLLTLARAIYNTPAGESGVSAPDPGELRSLPDRAAIEDRLLSAFVTAAYRNADTGPRVSRRPAGDGRALACPQGHSWRAGRGCGRSAHRRFISRSAFGLPLSVLGVAFAVMGGAAFGMERIPGDTTEAVSPVAVLARDRCAALLLTLVAGAAAAALTGVAVTSWDASYHSPDTGHVIALEDGLSMAAGTGVAVTVGLAVAGLGLAWPQWLIARGWLAFRGRLPFRLMAFLDDAHRRGVLRQAGPFYQFRHIELQHHLAARSQLGESRLWRPPRGAGAGWPRQKPIRWRLRGLVRSPLLERRTGDHRIPDWYRRTLRGSNPEPAG